MRWKNFTYLLLISLINFAGVLATDSTTTSSTTTPSNPQNSTENDLDGQICMTVESFRSAADAESFFECAPLSDQEVKEFGLEQKYLGIWKHRDCPSSFEFDEIKQRCVEKKKLRRQQAACGTDASVPGCYSPCQASNANPQVGGVCNWLTARLEIDPTSSTNFLQCAAQNSGETCGEWIRMACTPGTSFNYALQICTPTSLQCPTSTYAPICNCRQSIGGNQCPGRASCQQNVCCQSIIQPAVLSTAIQASPPVCIGSGVSPISSCTTSCPSSYECQPSIGCCPQTPQASPSLTITLCPGSGATPIGSCTSGSACPSGSSCNPQLGSCCPNAGNTYTAIILCPSGTPAVEPCGALNYCPDGLGCFQGACCPMVCPQGQSAQGFCPSNACSQGSCIGGCCCSQIHLPVCSNGQRAAVNCLLNSECGPGFECSNGGCCPKQFCPSGVQSSGHCMMGGCRGGEVCLENRCCPMPRCDNGGLAVRVCTMTANCGPGFECVGGGCCRNPTCPNGVVASKRCTTGGCCCPSGQACMNGGCCPMPRCDNGAIATSMCSGSFQCGRGSECVRGGCCSLPRCSSGAIAINRCQIGSGCSNGQMCENNVCCPMPVCSMTNQVGISVCGMGNACPIGYICEGRACCPEPLPLCPNGGRATQRCVRGSDCPAGFGCTPVGGCCRLSLEPTCPLRQNAICQCSSGNQCPTGASCNMGTCCTSAVATYNVVPGTQCQHSSQCNGYSSNCASCQQSVCICLKGAYSNGATCVQGTAIVLDRARRGCDQYGSPCRFHLSAARRKPLFAPVGNNTDNPLWYNVAGERHCVMNSTDIDPDSTCLPSEKCIDGKCRPKLWPGEYGCQSDLECSSRCSNTYCEQKSDKNVPQCQCRNGLLLYGRCFDKCPRGFHESGAYCMHDDDEAFWENGEAQEELQQLLNDGQC